MFRPNYVCRCSVLRVPVLIALGTSRLVPSLLRPRATSGDVQKVFRARMRALRPVKRGVFQRSADRDMAGAQRQRTRRRVPVDGPWPGSTSAGC